VSSRRADDAKMLATQLGPSAVAYGPTYAGMLGADLTIARGDYQATIHKLHRALKTADFWPVRMLLGRPTPHGDAYLDEFGEFQVCLCAQYIE
jgi:hypothetical protein